MEQNEKIIGWLNNLRLFALNSEVHCSREEKAIAHELIGTRNVNMAFDEMVKYMHLDLGFEYANPVQEQSIVEGGRQILLFSVGMTNCYADLTIMHEIMALPIRNYKFTSVKNEGTLLGIINWHEGLVPLAITNTLLGETGHSDKFVVVCDIGKELFAFAVTDIYTKYEIESIRYGKTISINGITFKHLDFASYEGNLIALRRGLEL